MYVLWLKNSCENFIFTVVKTFYFAKARCDILLLEWANDIVKFKAQLV